MLRSALGMVKLIPRLQGTRKRKYVHDGRLRGMTQRRTEPRMRMTEPPYRVVCSLPVRVMIRPVATLEAVPAIEGANSRVPALVALSRRTA